MKFKLKLLSPIHIKSGTKISPYADFIYEDKYLFYINNNELWGELSEKSEILEEYLKIIKERDTNASEKYTLHSFFKSNNIDFKNYILDKVKCNYNIKSLEVNEIIKTSGRPYIPGSSIKGAIRTAILYNYLKINGVDLEGVLRLSSKRDIRQKYVGQDVMRTRPKDIQSDIMRFLHVSDSNYTTMKDLSIKLEYNIDYLGVKACNELVLKSPVASESIDKDTIFEFDIKCLKENKFFKNEEAVLNCIRNFYRDLIVYHINVMKDSSEELFANVISKYTEYLNDINSGECILRLGSGKNFYDNTISSLFDPEVVNKRIAEVKYNPFPKTDWFALDSENNSVKESLGWVKIQLQ